MNENVKIAKELVKLAKSLVAMPKRIMVKYYDEEYDFIKDWCDKNHFYLYKSEQKIPHFNQFVSNGYFTIEPDYFPYKGGLMYHLDIVNACEYDPEMATNDFYGLNNVRVYCQGSDKEKMFLAENYPYNDLRRNESATQEEREKAETEFLKKMLSDALEYIMKDYEERFEKAQNEVEQRRNSEQNNE